jgi:hypothetical protein
MNGMSIFLTVVFLVGVVGGGAGYLIATNGVIHTQVKELTAQVASLQVANQELSTSLEANKIENDGLRKQVSDLTTALNTARSTNGNAQAQIESLTTQVASLQSQLASAVGGNAKVGLTTPQTGTVLTSKPLTAGIGSATLAELPGIIVSWADSLTLDTLVEFLFSVFALMLLGFAILIYILYRDRIHTPAIEREW